MGSPFLAGETVDGLMLRLLETNVKINRAKDLMTRLQNLVNHISEDTNRIELQLRPHLQSMIPEGLLSLHSESSSAITESTYFSHISSPVDSFTDRGSSSNFSNVNHVFDNMGFVNEQTWIQQALTYPRMLEYNCASVGFQNAVGGIVLPEKGKLLRSVKDAGPLLQTLPMWRHPPPQNINFAPNLTIKNHDIADMGTCADLQGDSFSDSLLNLSGLHSDPWIHDQVPGSKRQRPN